jgi:hypothetical protein
LFPGKLICFFEAGRLVVQKNHSPGKYFHKHFQQHFPFLTWWELDAAMDQY